MPWHSKHSFRKREAFLAVGQDQSTIDHSEAESLPLAIGGPEMLVGTLERNNHVLQRILG
jgi:hypothetical protein